MDMKSISSLLVLILPYFQENAVALDVYRFQEDGMQSDAHILHEIPANGGGIRPTFDSSNFTVCLRLKFFYLWEVSGFLQLSADPGDSSFSDLKAEVNLRYFRVRMGIFRRFFFLRRPLRALTWYHICITYASYNLTLYVNGALHEIFEGSPELPVGGTRLRAGSWDNKRTFSGELTEINVWNRRLLSSDVASLSNCTGDTEGDVIAWSSPWRTYGNVTKFGISHQKICEDMKETEDFFFPQLVSTAAFHVCEGLGGSVQTPLTPEDVAHLREVVSTFSNTDNRTCTRLWTGVTDQMNEEQWLYHNDNRPANISWRPGAPDGDVMQNCAAIDLEGSSTGLTDVSCVGKLCTVCKVPEGIVWSLLGACEEYPRNVHFIPQQKTSGELFFRGYSDYLIIKNDTNGRWTWWDRERNDVVAVLSKNDFGFPMGRHNWTLNRPMCDNKPPKEHILLLTPCGEGRFSCNDATCIPLYQRCDLKFDCRDQSDESDCTLVQFPPVYRKDLPPDKADSSSQTPLPVGVVMVLESADVSTRTMMIHTNYNLTLTWREGRVNYLNLNTDYTLNRVPYDTMMQLWVPTVDFTNTRGNHITHADHEATMMVLMLGPHTMGDDTRPEEVEVYAGWDNPLTIRRKYSETFQCVFDLSMYPFDRQECRLHLTMLSASSRLLVFDHNSTDAVFVGNPHLVEYTVGDVSVELQNEKDFAVMQVKISMVRRAGYILMNVYIPSLLLLVVSYVTLYFRVGIFQARVLGSLTALLVMATLFTQASSQLPKTSYFKLVDVWLLTCIIVIFIIIIFHVLIDRAFEMAENEDLPFVPPPSLAPRPRTQMVQPVEENAKEFLSTGKTKSHGWCRRQKPYYKSLVLGARLFVLGALVGFNLIYWIIVFSQ